ncbi:MAG: methylenetetrahydrofolate reductase [Actinobacteria bacterium]|nr:methylenetetrahydrofolate reductase [Actinomycetota bacterium]
MSLREALAAGEYVITAEVGPPKGTDVKEMLHAAAALKGRVHAVNVTDNQSAVVRLSPVVACHMLLERGLEPVLQLTCRDRNRLALQSELLGAASLGIKNVLALTGDHVKLGDHPTAKPVFDLESVQLLKVIGELNAGRDGAGSELLGPADFFAGAVVTPEANPLEPQMAKFEKKVAAGAKFFQTQAIYDLEKFASFMERARAYQVKILAGILLLKSVGMARYLNKNVAGVFVPEPLIEELKGAADPPAKGLEIAARQIRALAGVCDGVHIMAIGAEEEVPEILDLAGLKN